MTGEPLYRRFVRDAFKSMLKETTDTAFEKLFHELMAKSATGGYLPVRSSGDRGADGLGIWDGKLYACYGSTTQNPAVAIRKFRKDIQSACTNRAGEFREFVFVHNDAGGSHPDLGSAIAAAQLEYPGITITPWGEDRLIDLLLDLEPHLQRRILKDELDFTMLVSRTGIEEVSDLLDTLTKLMPAPRPDDMSSIPLPKENKLDFNRIVDWNREWLRQAWKYTTLVDTYYDSHRDEMAEPFAAQAMNSRYSELFEAGSDADEIIEDLLLCVGGGSLAGRKLMAAYTVLAYFLQRCHIFENPPDVGTQVETGSHAAS
ncbi:ABC-three component system protein [Glycomyces rhizosphaerae]|uniref:ABC-three component system protein n=1 Tax=Glycomyces rhizosphaerae TaxID=2054422 RepID=A0ABV7Q0Q2_9ACTN